MEMVKASDHTSLRGDKGHLPYARPGREIPRHPPHPQTPTSHQQMFTDQGEKPQKALETHLTRNDSNTPRSALSCTSLYHSSKKRVCTLPVHHRQHIPVMLTHRYICVYVYIPYIPILTHVSVSVSGEGQSIV